MLTSSDIQEFTIFRLSELMNRRSIDSSRVRYNNTFTLVEELEEVIDGWSKNRIKNFETVKSCIDELIDASKKDVCFNFGTIKRDGLESVLVDFSKNGENDIKNRRALQYRLRQLILMNKDTYLESLRSGLISLTKDGLSYEDKNFTPKLSEIDGILHSFCCQLIRMGHSKNYIKRGIEDLKNSYSKNKDFQNQFRLFWIQFAKLIVRVIG